jgi:hypothetical protein
MAKRRTSQRTTPKNTPDVNTEEQKILATREHLILTDRKTQILRNLRAEAGGGDYIDERLHRFPSESTLSWSGDTSIHVPSRKDRAFLINYAGRVVTKIVQYVFSQGVTREGVNEDFATDASKTGLSLDAFMRELSRVFLAGHWAWIGVDRGSPGMDPATGKPGRRSVKARKEAGDRIYWTIWNATEVVDWAFDSGGVLKWLMTEEDLLENDDPRKEAEVRRVRTLWERGSGVRLIMRPDSNTTVDIQEDFTLSAQVVPFTLIGIPRTRPHWFDDVERIQASILNLESAHHENLIKSVFPQLVIPTSLTKEIMALSDKTFEEALEMVRGIDWPLMEPNEASGLTRLLMPSAQDLKAIPDELSRRRRELFEIAGQALRSESKQVESGEAKAWDHRDVEATLADNATLIEEAEMKAIELSRALDTTFDDYAPIYPRQFDLPNLESDWKILTEMENTGNLPEVVLRQIAKTKVAILGRIVHLEDAVLQEALREIEDMTFDDLEAMTRQTLPPNTDPDDDDGDDEDVDGDE